jgi:hypothetical protein
MLRRQNSRGGPLEDGTFQKGAAFTGSGQYAVNAAGRQCQDQTRAVQQEAPLLDYVVGTGEQHGGIVRPCALLSEAFRVLPAAGIRRFKRAAMGTK